MEIYEKLLTVQTELKAPKSQYNPFGKYKFRSCEDILEALKPVLAKNKAAVFITDTVEMIGERYYVKAIVHFVDVETGDLITTTAFAREDEERKGFDGPQITGSSSSYARKYALNGMFDIDDTKDSDSTNTHEEEKPKTPREMLIAKLQEKGINLDVYASQKGLTRFTSQERYAELLKEFELLENSHREI